MQALQAPRSQTIKALPKRVCSQRLTVANAGTPYPSKTWINRNPLVLVASFFGWVIPAGFPNPAWGPEGNLNSRFFAAIQNELAHFPKGPDAYVLDFWWPFFAWHAGLFAVILFGQIGYNMRIRGYFDKK